MEQTNVFRGVSGVVLDASVEDITCREVAQAIKVLQKALPVITLRQNRAVAFVSIFNEYTPLLAKITLPDNY